VRRQQTAHIYLTAGQDKIGGLLEVLREPNNTYGDEVDRHNVVQDPRHQQDEDSRD
jgi:hypothetical protein